MLKTRLIPVLLLKNGILVRSKSFSLHQSTGNPLLQVERYTDWKADEIIYIDITRDTQYDLRVGNNVIGSTSSNANRDGTVNNNIIGCKRYSPVIRKYKELMKSYVSSNQYKYLYNHINNDFIEEYNLLKEANIIFDDLDKMIKDVESLKEATEPAEN